MLNARLEAEGELTGLTLDLGGGGQPSYKQVLAISGQFVNMDANEEAKPTVLGDLESELPFATEFADTVILFNTLEHVYEHRSLVKEMYRVLKPGGRALVFVPFVFPVHVHQTAKFFTNDYYRYTHSTLERMFTDAGFKRIQITPYGGLFLTLAEFIGMAVPWRLFRISVFGFCFLLEGIYTKLKPGVSAQRFPLAYYVVAGK